VWLSAQLPLTHLSTIISQARVLLAHQPGGTCTTSSTLTDIRTIQAYPISEEINIDVVYLPSGTALWSDALILHLLSLPSDARRRPSTQP
jgi:hypothetical protein